MPFSHAVIPRTAATYTGGSIASAHRRQTHSAPAQSRAEKSRATPLSKHGEEIPGIPLNSTVELIVLR